MLIKYQIQNTFKTLTGQTSTVSGGTSNVLSKSLTIPLNLNFYPIEYGSGVQEIVESERKKAINPVFDAETTKYKFRDDNNPLINSGKGLIIKFRFWNSTASTYSTSYSAADFNDLDVNKKRNGFKKSFFRLYFYDTNSGETSNLIFTEDLNVGETTQPIIPFNRLYWLRNDEYFKENNTNRVIYMDAKFFNAKTGKVSKFVNIPLSFTNSLMTINQYSSVSNRDWRTSAIEIVNPKLNNGEYNFRPYLPFGSNTPSVITLSEFVMV